MSHRRGDERGTVTAFVVVFSMTMILVVGLVLDGGMILAARRQAINEAEAAARAGAQAIDPASLRDGGPVVLDPAAAGVLAQHYLVATGHAGTVSVQGDTITVEVTFTRPMSILGLAGLGPATIHGRASAHGAQGVSAEGN